MSSSNMLMLLVAIGCICAYFLSNTNHKVDELVARIDKATRPRNDEQFKKQPATMTAAQAQHLQAMRAQRAQYAATNGNPRIAEESTRNYEPPLRAPSSRNREQKIVTDLRSQLNMSENV